MDQPQMKQPRLDEKRSASLKELLETIKTERQLFEESVLLAEKAAREQGKQVQDFKGQNSALEPAQRELVKSIRDQFDSLENQAKTSDELEDERLTDTAARLQWMRAYIMPAADIIVEARNILKELNEWGLPSEVLKKEEKLVEDLTIKAADPDYAKRHEAQALLYVLFEDYEYWDGYTDYARDNMVWTIGILLGALLAFSIFSFVLFAKANILCAFLLAGLAGACLSVANKLPVLSVYGDLMFFAIRAASRVAAGGAAAAMGFGLLALNLVRFPLFQNESCNVSEQASTIDNLIAMVQASGYCQITGVGILFALAFLLGFSERALTSLEDRIMGILTTDSSKKK